MARIVGTANPWSKGILYFSWVCLPFSMVKKRVFVPVQSKYVRIPRQEQGGE